MKTIHRTIVAALIFSADGKLLLGKKGPDSGGVYKDSWLIPGGGIEEGEAPLEALYREIKEETDIDLSPYSVTLLDNTQTGESKKIKDGEEVLCHMRFFDYQVKITDKTAEEIEVNLNDDLAEYQWASPHQLSGLQLSPPLTQLLTRLGYLS